MARYKAKKGDKKELSLYKKFISCMDLSDENIKEFAKIIKDKNIVES